MEKIEINPQFEQVLKFVNQTDQPVFLTGKAGTGKTTLLKYIRKNTFKQLAVVAPTGVAAINAGGSTIHSFFQFPFTPFLPALKDSGEMDLSKVNLPTLKYNSQRLAIFRNLELLVIDEISMVRADLLDQIDATLRYTRKKHQQPFGGVQLLLIGDMYQLPPVVQSEEWRLLSSVYKSPYFFESLAIRNHRPVYIELDKIYRQSEETFIQLLNKVRNNILDDESLALLNSHYKANLTEKDYHDNITLTTHNRKADEINSRNLQSLPGKEFKYRAKVDGAFSDKNFPADEVLTLKIGTRVMFLKNNNEKNYYNGKIGIITALETDKIKVKCEEDHAEIEVGRETWTNISYKIDKQTSHINEEILGTFNHYPLRLAWAITIHKSQGLTFDKLIIDAAESFSAGQVYVALSRCRSLKGLILSSKIRTQSLLNDHNILNFAAGKHDNEQVNSIFSTAQRSYISSLLIGLFDLNEVTQNKIDLAGALQMHKTRFKGTGQDWFSSLSTRIDLLKEVSDKFKRQLQGLLETAQSFEADPNLQTRLKQGAAYFEVEIKKCLDYLRECSLNTEHKEAASDVNDSLQNIFDLLSIKYELLKTCAQGFVFSDFINHKLKVKPADFKINVYASALNTKVSADIKHPALYRLLLLKRDEIVGDDRKPLYLVANNKAITELCNFLPETEDQLLQITGFGKAKVDEYGQDFLKVIKKYMQENDLQSQMHEKVSKKTKKSKKEKVMDYSIPDEPLYGSGAESKEKTVNTKEQTIILYRQGLKPAEIARQRGFALGTIEGHLVPYIQSGEIKLEDLIPKQKLDLILKAMENFNGEVGLSVLKNKLPEEISYTELKWAVAYKTRSE